MRARIIKRGERPIEIQDFDMLVVETEGGSPVAVCCRYGPEGSYMVSSVDDDTRFNQVLSSLGLEKVKIIDMNQILSPADSLPRL